MAPVENANVIMTLNAKSVVRNVPRNTLVDTFTRRNSLFVLASNFEFNWYTHQRIKERRCTDVSAGFHPFRASIFFVHDINPGGYPNASHVIIAW